MKIDTSSLPAPLQVSRDGGMQDVLVPVMLRITVDPLDGFLEEEAIAVALERLADLPLEVYLGRVRLPVHASVPLCDLKVPFPADLRPPQRKAPLRKDDYLGNVIDILADHFSVTAADVTMEATLEDLGVDSLDDIELVMQLEERYEIEISDEEMAHVRTVGDIVRFLEKRCGPQDPTPA